MKPPGVRASSQRGAFRQGPGGSLSLSLPEAQERVTRSAEGLVGVLSPDTRRRQDRACRSAPAFAATPLRLALRGRGGEPRRGSEQQGGAHHKASADLSLCSATVSSLPLCQLKKGGGRIFIHRWGARFRDPVDGGYVFPAPAPCFSVDRTVNPVRGPAHTHHTASQENQVLTITSPCAVSGAKCEQAPLLRFRQTVNERAGSAGDLSFTLLIHG